MRDFEKENVRLKNELVISSQQVRELERKIKNLEDVYQAELAHKEKKIEQLNEQVKQLSNKSNY